MFLIVAIKKLVQNFSWGSYGATLTRLKRSKLFLPATDKGEINFEYMEALTKTKEYATLNNALQKIKELSNIQ